ncbi:MAG: hypothetical protein WC860_09805, partial [Candidatus Margulisiibacteriota bacterium]
MNPSAATSSMSPVSTITSPVQTPQARINQSLEEARASVNRLLLSSFELQTIKLPNATFKEFFDTIAVNLNTAISTQSQKISLALPYVPTRA